MTDDYSDTALERLLDARAHRTPEPVDLGAAVEPETAALADVADLLWEAAHGAPPLDQDPVAAMLGLIPDPGYALDATSFTRARRAAGLKVGAVAARLRERGWDVTSHDLVTWETRPGLPIAPALIRAAAEVVGVPADNLTTRTASAEQESWLGLVVKSAPFRQLAERWAVVKRVSPAQALSELQSRAAVTVHRGDQPDPDQLLRSLEVLVQSVEKTMSDHHADEP